MKPCTLSTRLTRHADDLRGLAHLCHLYNPSLANALIVSAARVALEAGAAETLERELGSLRRSFAELQANALEEAEGAEATARAVAAIEARHARSRTIAAILAPVLAGTARLDDGNQADAA